MTPKIGIVGCGLIGKSWTMIFVANGYDVYLYDIVAKQVDKAIISIREQIEKMAKDNVLRGSLNAEQQLGHIFKANTLKECIDGAVHVQECVYENLELKKKVMSEIDAICSDNLVICSSTSCFLPSLLFDNLKHKSNMLVGHPINPPYFVPLVEIVPSPWTNMAIVKQTRELFEQMGQKPVVLQKEVAGFIVNRIQYAILNECYRLIDNGIISVSDVDKVMAHGLGMRYAFMGPWETAHLNANGMKEYFEKYAQGIYDVSMTFGPVPMMTGPTAKLIENEMTNALPLNQLEQRRNWRDERLIELASLKKKSLKK